ncbi:hypothetical protein SNE40_003817 [Patella caerulea]|uniref:Uncharacterized protein n=1 Tax=Patella caerulea TaxID=87958 RepID=A0AAN8Q924_PATCE
MAQSQDSNLTREVVNEIKGIMSTSNLEYQQEICHDVLGYDPSVRPNHSSPVTSAAPPYRYIPGNYSFTPQPILQPHSTPSSSTVTNVNSYSIPPSFQPVYSNPPSSTVTNVNSYSIPPSCQPVYSNPPWRYASYSPTYVTSALSTPRLSTFSGDGNKGDVLYNQWRLEIMGLQQEGSHSVPVIINTIRRAARGTAAEFLIGINPQTVDEVFMHFDPLFGDILSVEVLMNKLYTSKQQENESISSWACKIKHIVSKLITADILVEPASNKILKDRFWHGLSNSQVKSNTRHILDADVSFSVLMTAVRKAEEEMNIFPATFNFANSPFHLTSTTSNSSDTFQNKILLQISGLSEQLKTVNSRISDMEHQMQKPRQRYYRQPPSQFNSSNIRDPHHQVHVPPFPPPPLFNPAFRPPNQFSNTSNYRPRVTPICYACQQPGHRRGDRECTLNSQGLIPRGGR